MSRATLALHALRLAVTRSKADPTPDYDLASTDYDAFFSRVMGGHSIDMLDAVTLHPGDDIVELACGTGHLSEEIARRLDGRGSVRAVDKSPGMLAVAAGKLARFEGLHVDLREGDMLEFLRSLPSDSADVVVIGWAICYSKPVRLLSEARRVLRPGGQVAVIETRADALLTMRKALERVVESDPSLLTALISVALPKNSATLGRWFRKAELSASVLRDGEQLLPCATADQAVEWMERSGAGAGFRDAFDQTREAEVRRRFAEELGREGQITLLHTFVVGVAHRSNAPSPQSTSAQLTDADNQIGHGRFGRGRTEVRAGRE
jgi:ubiquinone/menaquinone biosynthesis C-methylase UbiE